MSKAKNAPPWTRKKLRPYRAAQEKKRMLERKAERRMLADLVKSGVHVDNALRGCAE